jgi:hypothetical protein
MDRSLVQVISDGLHSKSARLGSASRWEHSRAACDAISAVWSDAWARAGVVHVESSPRRAHPAPAAIGTQVCVLMSGAMPIRLPVRRNRSGASVARRIAGLTACTAVRNPRVPTKDKRRSLQSE